MSLDSILGEPWPVLEYYLEVISIFFLVIAVGENICKLPYLMTGLASEVSIGLFYLD